MRYPSKILTRSRTKLSRAVWRSGCGSAPAAASAEKAASFSLVAISTDRCQIQQVFQPSTGAVIVMSRAFAFNHALKEAKTFSISDRLSHM
jgi:hypothetical protein